MRKRNKTVNISIIIFIVLVFSFGAIIVKLSLVSLSKETDGINLTEFVENRNTETETLTASRGSIYTSDGEILAQNVNSYTVIAYLSSSRTKDVSDPQHVVDKEMTAKVLAPLLDMEYDTLLNLLNKDAYQVELGPGGRGISTSLKLEIEALDLPGIDFVESQKRYYPMGDFASYIVGYAQQDEDEDKITGKMGVESYLDDDLQGEDGYTIYQKDLYGYRMPNTTTMTVEAQNGSDVYLTIDSKIQMFVENGIDEISKDNGMEWLTFTVMDAKTGAIVASASNPSFNPNTREIESYLNPLVSYQYEPGSTMKIFSFLASMENDNYDGDATYKSGKIVVDDSTIRDFNNGRGWGTITFDSGFAYSSNVAASTLALKLGREKLYNYYSSLGFGKKTGISLPSEEEGSIDFTYRTEVATASFGQGITTTPIQNLQALTLLTNDGIELQPYIVEKVVDSETGEVTYQHEVTELGRKASSENVTKMLSLMYDVVYSGKTDAKYYQTDGITVVGKTGTAQISGSNGKYMTGKYDYIRSFAGIFPYEDPQYIIYVSVKKYDGVYKDFAKMVTNVIEEIAKYKNISELIEEVDVTKIVTMDNYINSDITETEKKLKKLGITVVKLGDGKYVINQYPEKGTTILAGNKVFLVSNDGNFKMPDIKGWSSSEVITLCKLLGISYNLDGYGVVSSYSIKSGTVITSDMNLEVKLEEVG